MFRGIDLNKNTLINLPTKEVQFKTLLRAQKLCVFIVFWYQSDKQENVLIVILEQAQSQWWDDYESNSWLKKIVL